VATLRDGFDPGSVSDVTNAQHIATIGFRLGLNLQVAVPSAFPEYLQREFARQPLPPAACVRDDERLLLGVALALAPPTPDSPSL
jgi:hypothetical protein